VKDPDWFVPYLQQGAFTEVEKLFRFLVRVESPAFSLSTLLFVRNFIMRVKPTYTFPMFVVSHKVKDATIDVTMELDLSVALTLVDIPCSNFRGGLRFDDTRGDGTVWNQFDSNSPFDPAPTYPSGSPTHWGYDRELLCPADYIIGECCVTFLVDTPPTFDGVFSWDVGVFTDEFLSAGMSYLATYYPTGTALYPTKTSTGVFSLDTAFISLDSMLSPDAVALELHIYKNGVLTSTIPFTTLAGVHYETFLPISPAVSVVASDVIELRIASGTGATEPAAWVTVTAKLGGVYAWSYDVDVPAGTYCATKLM